MEIERFLMTKQQIKKGGVRQRRPGDRDNE